MTKRTITEVSLEKLVPPSSVAGMVLEVAEVTRAYEIDVETGIRTEYGTPHVGVIVGKTIKQLAADLEEQRIKIAAVAELEMTKLDARRTSISSEEEVKL